MDNFLRKHKNKIDYNSEDYYLNFKKFYPEIKISQFQHSKIIFTFFRIVIRKIVLEMYRFSFSSLGLFYLTKKKYKIKLDKNGRLIDRIPINWPETKRIHRLTGDKTKKVIYLNNHTNGYIYKLKWFKGNMRFVNRSFYSLIPATDVKRFINKSILSSIKPLNAYIS